MDDGEVVEADTTRRDGAPNAVPVLVLCDEDARDGIVALLDEVAVVHAFDARGRAAAGERSMDRLVADVEALRRHWGHERVAVVGHAFGAALALAYSGAHPDRTASTGCLGGLGIGERAIGTAAAGRGADGSAPDDLERELVSDAEQIGAAVRTSQPVFFVHGAADPRPVANVVALAAKAPVARKRLVEGAGHRPWIERPDDVRDLLHEIVRAGEA